MGHSDPRIVLGFNQGSVLVYRIRANVYSLKALRIRSPKDLSSFVEYPKYPITHLSCARSYNSLLMFIVFAQEKPENDPKYEYAHNYIKVIEARGDSTQKQRKIINPPITDGDVSRTLELMLIPPNGTSTKSELHLSIILQHNNDYSLNVWKVEPNKIHEVFTLAVGHDECVKALCSEKTEFAPCLDINGYLRNMPNKIANIILEQNRDPSRKRERSEVDDNSKRKSPKIRETKDSDRVLSATDTYNTNPESTIVDPVISTLQSVSEGVTEPENDNMNRAPIINENVNNESILVDAPVVEENVTMEEVYVNDNLVEANETNSLPEETNETEIKVTEEITIQSIADNDIPSSDEELSDRKESNFINDFPVAESQYIIVKEKETEVVVYPENELITENEVSIEHYYEETNTEENIQDDMNNDQLVTNRPTDVIEDLFDFEAVSTEEIKLNEDVEDKPIYETKVNEEIESDYEIIDPMVNKKETEETSQEENLQNEEKLNKEELQKGLEEEIQDENVLERNLPEEDIHEESLPGESSPDESLQKESSQEDTLSKSTDALSEDSYEYIIEKIKRDESTNTDEESQLEELISNSESVDNDESASYDYADYVDCGDQVDNELYTIISSSDEDEEEEEEYIDEYKGNLENDVKKDMDNIDDVEEEEEEPAATSYTIISSSEEISDEEMCKYSNQEEYPYEEAESYDIEHSYDDLDYEIYEDPEMSLKHNESFVETKSEEDKNEDLQFSDKLLDDGEKISSFIDEENNTESVQRADPCITHSVDEEIHSEESLTSRNDAEVVNFENTIPLEDTSLSEQVLNIVDDSLSLKNENESIDPMVSKVNRMLMYLFKSTDPDLSVLNDNQYHAMGSYCWHSGEAQLQLFMMEQCHERQLDIEVVMFGRSLMNNPKKHLLSAKEISEYKAILKRHLYKVHPSIRFGDILNPYTDSFKAKINESRRNYYNKGWNPTHNQMYFNYYTFGKTMY
ncbi:MAG: hypothetical protein EXX96DRAFT_565944 [Benjaminiella poitrasii]|nr:MAG: hypothetical protein EXX96DRAFT_565944 [Benjaminiella poitrasii]